MDRMRRGYAPAEFSADVRKENVFAAMNFNSLSQKGSGPGIRSHLTLRERVEESTPRLTNNAARTHLARASIGPLRRAVDCGAACLRHLAP